MQLVSTNLFNKLHILIMFCMIDSLFCNAHVGYTGGKHSIDLKICVQYQTEILQNISFVF